MLIVRYSPGGKMKELIAMTTIIAVITSGCYKDKSHKKGFVKSKKVRTVQKNPKKKKFFERRIAQQEDCKCTSPKQQKPEETKPPHLPPKEQDDDSKKKTESWFEWIWE